MIVGGGVTLFCFVFCYSCVLLFITINLQLPFSYLSWNQRSLWLLQVYLASAVEDNSREYAIKVCEKALVKREGKVRGLEADENEVVCLHHYSENFFWWNGIIIISDSVYSSRKASYGQAEWTRKSLFCHVACNIPGRKKTMFVNR